MTMARSVLTCVTCKKQYTLIHRYSKAYIAKRKFCSQACYHKSPDSKVGKYKVGHAGMDGEANPSWKGGRWVNKLGYVVVSTGKKRTQLEHRLVVEKRLGRRLKTGENIHHINHDKTDNRPENLLLLSASDHTKLHWEIKRSKKVGVI